MKKILAFVLAICLISVFPLLSSAENMGTLIEYDSSWKISASTETQAEPAIKAFDGDANTYWHTFFTYFNGKVQEKADYPHVMTVTFPEEMNISGWRYTPRNDNATGIMLKYEIYASKDGEAFNLIYKGETSQYATGINAAEFKPSEASWGNVSMKAIKIVITEGRSGHGTAAEIEFFKDGEGAAIEDGEEFNAVSPYGEKVPYNASWKLETSTMAPGYLAEKAFDGDVVSHWHTNFTITDGKVSYTAEYPHWMTITFPEKTAVSGLLYVPRTDLASGVFQNYTIYTSLDGTTFTKETEGTFPYQQGSAAGFKPTYIYFGEKEIKALKIETTKTISGHGTIAELEIYKGEPTGNSSESGNALGKTDKRMGALLSRDGWKYSVKGKSTNLNLAFDGDPGTNWHSWFRNENGATVEKDEVPFEIVITLPSETKVSGWAYTPRTDNAAGTFTEYNIYVSLDGSNYTKVYSGSFDYRSGPATNFKTSFASWGDKNAKFVKIEATKTLAGYGTASEINLFTGGVRYSENPLEFKGEDGTHSAKAYITETANGVSKKGKPFVDRKDWQVSASSDQATTVSKMFDGKTDTYWHTHFSAVGGVVTEHETAPYYITVILPEVTEISGISMLPRQDMAIGCFTSVDIYASETDDGEWELVKENEACSGNMTLNEFHFASNIKVKKLRIKADAVGYGTCAEFNLIAKNEELPSLSYEEFLKNEEANRLYKIDTSLFVPEYSGMDWGVSVHDNVFDGAVENYWQTVALPADETVVLTIDMREVYEVSAIEVYPRETADHHGAWLKANLFASKDNENWELVAENATFGENLNIREFIFETPVEARYFEFEITEYVAKRVSAGEIYFYQTKEAKDKREKLKEETYGLKIGSKEITYNLKGEDGKKEIDVAPFIINGSTMIPLRGLLELMGAEITWYGEDQSIDIDNGTYFIKLQIDNHLVYVKHPVYGDIRYTLLANPVIVEGRTFIPLRFVSEQLGYNVSWNGETQEITITNK